MSTHVHPRDLNTSCYSHSPSYGNSKAYLVGEDILEATGKLSMLDEQDWDTTICQSLMGDALQICRTLNDFYCVMIASHMVGGLL